MKSMFIRSAACISVLSTSMLAVAAQQDADPAPAPAIAIYSGGVDFLKQSPKDRALYDALMLLQQNGLDLPAEAQSDMPPGAVEGLDLLIDVLMSRMSFTLSFNDEAIKQGDMESAVQLQWTVYGNSGVTAEALHQQVQHLFKASNGAPTMKPVDGHAGLDRLDAPVPVYMGVQEIDGEQAMVLSVNHLPETTSRGFGPDGMFPGPGGPGTFMAGIVDFNRMNTMLHTVMSMAEMQGNSSPGMDPREVMEMLTRFGIMGPDAMRYEWNISSSDDGAGHTTLAIRNYRQHFGSLLADAAVSRDDLQMVPEDANSMSVNVFRIPAILDLFASASRTPEGRAVEPTPMDMALSMIQGVLGVNLRTQFIDYMGNTIITYRSKTTGGGGFMSGVMLVELSNADGMKQSMATMRGHLNKLAQRQADGHVRLINWTDGACEDITTLAFPGLPIPVELSMAVCNDMLILGLSPQAVVAASRQADADRSILDNASFRAAKGPAGVGKSMGMQFVDVPAQLADGYAMMNAAMAAISNFTRPRIEPSRGVNMILPTYPELAKGARANVMTAAMDGDDLLITCNGDGSFTVQMTAMMSDPLLLVLPAAMTAGVLVPALESARESARMTQSRVQARHLAHAALMYSGEHDGKFPESLEVLVAKHYVTEDMLFDERTGRKWTYRNPGDQKSMRTPSEWPLIYEADAHSLSMPEGGIVVAFADGHVRVVQNPHELDTP